jgi:hypothetical protein
MKYRSKNDIKYLDFIAFTEAIEGMETDLVYVATNVVKYFKTTDIEGFSKALESKKKPVLRFKVDLNFEKAVKFIDADTLVKDGDVIDFLKLVTKKKYFWQKIDYNKVSLAEVEYVLALFTNALPK